MRKPLSRNTKKKIHNKITQEEQEQEKGDEQEEKQKNNENKLNLRRDTTYYSQTFCFLDISFERAFEESRIWMAVSSSRMLPSEADSVSRILSSISFSCFLLAADCSISALLSSSSSGLGSMFHTKVKSL